MSLSLASGNLLADRRYEYARAYAADGDHAAAADLLEQALELAPGWVAAWVALGTARAKIGDGDGAAEAFRAALARDPEDALGAGLMLAGLGGAPVPAAPPEAYVRGLFDDYAPRFETALVGDLGYRTPEALGALLAAVAPGRRFARALDLGCGTGLMAPILRPLADRLDGLDLSPAMVERARGKNLYDALAVGEAVAWLGAGSEPFDLVVAADVLVYLGDLAPLFDAVAARLASNGLFAFSVEAGEDGFTLRDSLRYAHGGPYVRGLAAERGLAMVAEERGVLRHDRGAPIEGLLFVTTAPG